MFICTSVVASGDRRCAHATPARAARRLKPHLFFLTHARNFIAGTLNSQRMCCKQVRSTVDSAVFAVLYHAKLGTQLGTFPLYAKGVSSKLTGQRCLIHALSDASSHCSSQSVSSFVPVPPSVL